MGRTAAYAIAAIGFLAAGPARAVDLVNRDRVAHEVVVNKDNGASEIITVPPRETINGICESCVVLLGESSVEAVGSVTVRIEDGEVSISAR